MTKLDLCRSDKLYLIERDGIYYVCGTIKGKKRIRKSCETRNLEQAKIFMEALSREYLSGWRTENDDPDLDWKTVAGKVCERHRASARTRGMLFDLRPSDVYAMMRATGFRCSLSGVPFSKIAGFRDPWGPSIDRIENRHGYTLDNVRLVSLAANIAMSNWGFDVLLRLSRGVVFSSERVSTAEPQIDTPVTPDTGVSAQIIEMKRELN